MEPDVPYRTSHWTRKIESAFRLQAADCLKNIMRAGDVSCHRREAIAETFGHETLCGEMIAFIELVPAENLENAR